MPTRLAGLILSLLLPTLAGAASGELQSIRVSDSNGATRVVMDLSKPLAHRIFTLHNPNRVVIDLPGGQMLPGAPIANGQGLVANVRTGKHGNGDLRIVLDLNEAAQPRSFLAGPEAGRGHRLVVDLGQVRQEAPKKTLSSTQRHGRDVIVAIDAGHGGKDPGATGRKGTREKDVVLDVSRKLAERINAQPGMRAVLIRDGDYFLHLRERMERARRAKADLFVSIHADAVPSSQARGASVYVLSEKGASDEAARRLAERENASDLVGGVRLSDKDDVLASVLLDLSQTAALSASMNIGDEVLDELGRLGKLHRSNVQSAGFAVLKSPDIPSILVETAFISNPSDEKSLRSDAYQALLAQSVLTGIVDFFNRQPPPGTLLAESGPQKVRAPIQHVIARGDTLSEIASRYNISLGQLRSVNKLKNDRIRVGQVLTIPIS